MSGGSHRGRSIAGRVAALMGLVVLIAATVFLSVDLCKEPTAPSPTVKTSLRAHGELKVGAARVEIAPPFPVSRAGYGLAGPSSVTSGTAIYARAMVLEVGNQRLSLVLVDTLYVTSELRQAIASNSKSTVFVIATHTHSSLGGFDRRLVAQMAGAGRFRHDVETSIVTAAKAAIGVAEQHMRQAHIEVSEPHDTKAFTVARSGSNADRQLTVVKFVAENVNAPSTIAQWIMFAAHPTMVSVDSTQLDGDWPGRLSQQYEGNGGQTTFVFQTAVGNSSIDRSQHQTPDEFAHAVAREIDALNFTPHPPSMDLGLSEVQMPLPKLDASRLVPRLLSRLVENSICYDNATFASVSLLRLGDFSMQFFPFEVTAEASAELLAQRPGHVTISLANGYMGYLESTQRLGDGSGEGSRQYFGAELFHAVRDAMDLTNRSVSTNDQ